MVRLAHCNDPLIGRAFALYDVHRDGQGEPTDLSMVDVTKGKFTIPMARCGPEPMMEGVSRIAIRQTDGSWDYRRTCVEGPIFSADSIAW